MLVTPGPLPFDHGSFDVVLSKEVALQIRTWTAIVPVLESGEHCPHQFRVWKLDATDS